MKNGTLIIALVASGLTLNSCGKKDEDKSSSEETGGTVSGGGGGGGGGSSATLASATNVGDLQLSSAFKIELPAALSGDEGAALLQSTAKKSQEACQMGQTVKESTKSVESVGNFFCHLEVEKDRIQFGKKYKLTASGQDFARIFVDNSSVAEGKITIGFCSQHGDDESNKELIVIEGLSDSGPKGSVYSQGSSTRDGKPQTWANETSFDKTAQGVIDLVTSQLHTHDGNSFRRKVELAITAGGLTNVKLAANGTWDGISFSERGAAIFDGSFGSAIYQNAGSHNNSEFSFSRRAYFNVSGDVLTSADVPSTVIPLVADVPSFLDANFSPSMPEGWVSGNCEDFEETIDINPESAEHASCDGDHEQRDCWDQTKFDPGSESVSLD